MPPFAYAFDDRFVRSLPADADLTNRPRQVMDACYTLTTPTPVRAPRLLACAADVAHQLAADADHPDFLAAMAGNTVLPGMRPYSACYGGHQFGHWAGQLGDGRAITLAEVATPEGTQELQLKGAGPTPYSRSGDGRAVLRSSVREFLCSEAMHHLGVPTTRALCLVGTGESVIRDAFYDGHPGPEPGAIVCRVAPSFLRLGSFEIHAARGDLDRLSALGAYVLTEHFPTLGPLSPTSLTALLAEVAGRTARLMVDWHRVGFVHGVMNTDNLSVLGLTLDYGPYGWLEDYDPDWTPNTTDAGNRRYRFGQQPAVAAWNLTRFAEALLPLVGASEPLKEALSNYDAVLGETMRGMVRSKLGLTSVAPEDGALLLGLVRTLRVVETDYTLFHRFLADVVPDDDDVALIAPLTPAFYAPPSPDGVRRIAGWVRDWLARVAQERPDPVARRLAMNRVNPRFVLRNWLVQQAIDRATDGDLGGVEALMVALRTPYDTPDVDDGFAVRRPEWARNRPGCGMLSCSS